MIQVSLDDEPPPVFRGKKEVKKKTKNLPQLAFSFKNEINKNYLKNSNNKKLEDKIKNNPSNTSSTEDYSSLEKFFSENNINSSNDKIEFFKKNISDKNLSSESLNYLKIKQENIQENPENSNFYFKNIEYNFIFSQTFIKDNNKEKKDYFESEEKQEKEPSYTLFSFEEKKTTEENTIKWNATAYN